MKTSKKKIRPLKYQRRLRRRRRIVKYQIKKNKLSETPENISNSSTHIFMFPFTYDLKEDKDQLYQIYKTMSKDINWKLEKTKYEITDDKEMLDYNMNAFYYRNVLDAIYGNELIDDENNFFKRIINGKHSIEKIVNGSPLLRYSYLPAIEKELKYVIKVLNKDKLYELSIDSIQLNMYTTNVGVLTYTMTYNNPSSIDEVNTINEYGRRVYPQFLSKKDFDHTTIKERVNATKNVFLGDKLQIKSTLDESLNITEEFENKEILSNIPIAKTVMEVLGSNFTEHEILKGRNKKIHIKPVIDDRMFVMCRYTDEAAVDEVRQTNEESGYSFLNEKCESAIDTLYKFIFIENSRTCQNKPLAVDYLEKHTYRRWIDYGSIYGVSHYSFMLLNNYYNPTDDFLDTHMRTLYKEMVLLLFVQRASMLKFEEDISKFTNEDIYDRPNKKIKSINLIHEKYLKYKNMLYFRDVTAQEQGRELYTLLGNIFHIRANSDDLQGDIKELQDLAKSEGEKITNTSLNFLAILAGVFTIPSFISGLMGMNVNVTEDAQHILEYNTYAVFGGSIVLSLLMYLVIRLQKKVNYWHVLIAVIFGGLALAIVAIYEKGFFGLL